MDVKTESTVDGNTTSSTVRSPTNNIRGNNVKKKFECVSEELEEESIFGLALINKRGDLIKENLPDDMVKDTFSTMCATIVGAACQTSFKLTSGNIERSITHFPKGGLVLDTIDGKILSVLVEKDGDAHRVAEKVKEAIDDIKTCD